MTELPNFWTSPILPNAESYPKPPYLSIDFTNIAHIIELRIIFTLRLHFNISTSKTDDYSQIRDSWALSITRLLLIAYAPAFLL